MRKRLLKTMLSIATAALFVIAPGPSYSAGITAYRAAFRPFNADNGDVLIAIRDFEKGADRLALTVNPNTFETAIMEEAKTRGKWTDNGLADTPFMKALSRYAEPRAGTEEHGLRNAPTERAVFITVDLCPSPRGLDYGLFRFIEAYSKGESAPAAIAVSGGWIKKHAEDLKWLVNEAKAGRLDITWVNHSYSHPYKGNRPIGADFLLADKDGFEEEVLSNEALMLESGITPSPFFRFPGLVTDAGLLSRLKKLSLIPIGSDAWLAKGQAPGQGSVILVHGNGNEPAGVAALFKYLNAPLAKGSRIRTLALKSAFR